MVKTKSGEKYEVNLIISLELWISSPNILSILWICEAIFQLRNKLYLVFLELDGVAWKIEETVVGNAEKETWIKQFSNDTDDTIL